jgi:two-component system chemotaxis response regulator CheY
MFNNLFLYSHRLFKAKNISGALKQIISPSLVNALSKTLQKSELIEAAAMECNIGKYELLGAVAKRLNLLSEENLHRIDSELVISTGYSPEYLRNHNCIPQKCSRNRTGYRLVIADPELISIDAFQNLNITVSLALSSDIEKYWKDFFNFSDLDGFLISQEDVNCVVEQIVADAKNLGATEVFIGHPDSSRYEFIVNGQRFVGKLSYKVFEYLLKQCSKTGGLQLEEEQISLAITRNFDSPVICVSWSIKNLNHSDIKFLSSSNELHSEQTPQTHLDNSAVSILLIDDDHRFSYILAKVLENKGYNVTAQPSGSKAIDFLKLEANRISLIICDVHMPEQDGLSVVAKIKSTHPGIPILMLTSDEDDFLEAEIALVGANAYVKKQDDPRILLAWVVNLVGGNCSSNSTIARLPKVETISHCNI